MERLTSIEMQNEKVNLMTQETLVRLQKQLEQVGVDYNKVTESFRKSVGDDRDWHDNPHYDSALIDSKVVDERLKNVMESLRRVEILSPRQEVDEVGLGNTVRLRFKGEDEDSLFTILGRDDGMTGMNKNPRWINYETPLAQAIMGAKVGDVAKYNDGLEVKVKEILPGQFDNNVREN